MFHHCPCNLCLFALFAFGNSIRWHSFNTSAGTRRFRKKSWPAEAPAPARAEAFKAPAGIRARKAAASMGLQANSSNETSHGTSQFNCTSFWFRRTSLCRRLQVGPQTIRANLLDPAIQGINGAKLAQQFRSSFWPTPGTPGMLSTVSPVRLNQSTICVGSTPALALTSSAPQSASVLSLGIEQPNLRRNQLHKILVRTGNDDFQVVCHRFACQGGDAIIRLAIGPHERKNTGCAQVGHYLVDLSLQIIAAFRAAAPCIPGGGSFFREPNLRPTPRPGAKV
jgi:hypothetical protein